MSGDTPAYETNGAPEAAPGGAETLLLADDADAVRDVTRRLLQGAGYRVVAAANGQEAVDLFQRTPGAIDLVVLDAVMPRLSGPAAFAQMRTLRPDLRAVFLSGYSADVLGPEWLDDGGVELVMKPVTRAELLRRVRGALDAPPRSS